MIRLFQCISKDNSVNNKYQLVCLFLLRNGILFLLFSFLELACDVWISHTLTLFITSGESNATFDKPDEIPYVVGVDTFRRFYNVFKK